MGSFPPGLPHGSPKYGLWRVGGTDTGVWCQGPNWLSNIMPQIEQAAMFIKLNDCLLNESSACDDCDRNKDNKPWREFGILKLPFLQCPSAESTDLLFKNWALEHLAKGNYAANFGSDTFLSFESIKTAGAFGVIVPRGTEKVTQTLNHPSQRGLWKAGWGQGTRFADFTDGLSNTLLVSEVLAIDEEADGRGTWVWAGMVGSTFTAKYGPNSDQNDVIPGCSKLLPTSDPLHCTQNQTNGNVWASTRSRHSGGVNASMADGSGRFFTNDIEIAVWRSLSTRGGAEATSPP
jgi:prepilin-type processing-associated H-X9-DG protein